MGRRPITWSDDARAEFQRLWLDGVSARKMGDLFGCHKDSVARHARRMGLPERRQQVNRRRAQLKYRAANRTPERGAFMERLDRALNAAMGRDPDLAVCARLKKLCGSGRRKA